MKGFENTNIIWKRRSVDVAREMMLRGVLWRLGILCAIWTAGWCVQEDDCDARSGVTSSGLAQITAVEDSAHSDFVGLVLRVQDRLDTLVKCEEVEFKNTQSIVDISPHTTKFSRISDSTANQHAVYGNDKYFMFYIETGQGGTWMVGETPGVDRGHAYSIVKGASFSPAGLSDWFWLRDAEWKKYPEIRVECSSGSVEGQVYIVQLINNIGIVEEGTLIYSADDSSHSLDIAGLHIKITGIQDLYEMGEEMILPGGADAKEQGEGEEGILSVIENTPESMWQLIFNLKGGGERRVSVPRQVGDEGLDTPLHATSDVGGILTEAEPGEYVWAFYEGRTLPLKRNHDVVAIQQVLLLAVTRGVFRAFPADRNEAMSQHFLSSDVDLLTFTDSELAHPDGSRFRVVSCRNLGRADVVIRGIQAHLLALEKQRNPSSGGMTPACFLYHSSLSLPSPLVYAAEIVCLLMGAKPVVMIQYTTPSEHQWKFPLVQSLVRVIAANIYAAEHTEDKVAPALGMRIFSYRDDKSLILFRGNREYLVDALMPRNQSQALHPTPYPDESGPMVQEEYRLQVYNSYWNGFVLGYPLGFVNVYCEDFHNPLSRERKRLIAREAHADVGAHFDSNSLETVQIALGLDSPLSEATMKSLYDSLSA